MSASSALGGRSALPMGPDTATATPDASLPASSGPALAPAPLEAQAFSAVAPRPTGPLPHLEPVEGGTTVRFATTTPPTQMLAISSFLYTSRPMSGVWLVVRLWLGYQWVNAGYQKIWGSERALFWFGGGAGVRGFATGGVVGSTAGKGAGASYGWWAAVLHDFVVPNAPWIAKLVSLGELAIGVALIFGLFTGVAAFGGLLLNMTYMFSGSAGVNPMYVLLEVLVILAWRNAGWLGLDRFALRTPWTPRRLGRLIGRIVHRRVVAAPLAS